MKKTRKKWEIIRKEQGLRIAPRSAFCGGHPHEVPVFGPTNRKENPGGKIIGNSPAVN
ncbi:hypothetical protein [Paraburkholderia acidiphila]|uniref:Uncharacterized protein n=1 Tax=Paraburkholderia acidiphila TaxID=2571747 RepID=A0A7Z2JB84_9BURK|nr:hypothetical protein [Paraburkholderia acidiphila]QGZ58251.1 hypothetical protein FAZ97_24940 [Paraburkholderia acidiphila]